MTETKYQKQMLNSQIDLNKLQLEKQKAELKVFLDKQKAEIRLLELDAEIKEEQLKQMKRER
jgi:ribonuclease PH